jgi:predicted O-methyltransferase YrrM
MHTNIQPHTGTDEIDTLMRALVKNFNDVSRLDIVWKHGVVHRGGPHYRLRGTLGPISLGEDECAVFGRFIKAFRPRNCFIIGNAFGMSSVFIAKMMERNGGTSVITLDSQSEGDGKRCFSTAAQISQRMDCRILKNKTGWSPNDIAAAVEDAKYDLIFIDGDHSHPQVTRDFEGIQRLVGDETTVCWHDYWMDGIPESVEVAESHGYHCIKVNSSCEMVLGTKNREVFDRICKLYSNTERPRKRRRTMAYLKLYSALAGGAVKKYIFRQN